MSFLEELTRHPERCPVMIKKVDFAVPTTGSIGERFDTFEEAVAEARLRIGATYYRGASRPDDKPEVHPKRIFWVYSEDGSTKLGTIHFHRAFVHTRLVASWAVDAARGTGTDTVIATEEIFIQPEAREAMTAEALTAYRGHVPSIRHREAMSTP